MIKHIIQIIILSVIFDLIIGGLCLLFHVILSMAALLCMLIGAFILASWWTHRHDDFSHDEDR